MATTSTTGATSGSSATTGSVIDVASIVSGLMQVENRPLDALNAKIAASNTKISVLGQFQSKLSAVQTALHALQNTSNFSSTLSSSNTSVATANATGNIAAGRYSLDVSQTAETALIQAIKHAGLIGLCVNSDENYDSRFDCDKLPVDEIYNSLKDRKTIY